ncbi:hypothetical protein [Xanthobacter sp. KR7-225]|uniref:hypothetical protein n=1 Tax=Xanthobacter sp. KR7-225 TaxID=3156613 RepID=UPI0032B3BE49
MRDAGFGLSCLSVAGRRGAARLAAGFLAAALALAAPPAGATTDPERFQRFLYSDAYRALLAKAWARVPKAVLPDCPSLTDGKISATLRQDVAFDGRGMPVSGSWWVRYPVSGCGAERIVNILFVADREGVRTLVTLPGTTRADVVLQRDALMYAFVGAGTRAPADCKDMLVTDTSFEGFGLAPGPGRPPQAGPWRETWTVAACGRTFAVPMEFIPDATGTTINQRPAEIREVGK